MLGSLSNEGDCSVLQDRNQPYGIIEAGHSDTNSIKQTKQGYVFLNQFSTQTYPFIHIHPSTDHLCQAQSVRPATEARQKESPCGFFHSRVCRAVPPEA